MIRTLFFVLLLAIGSTARASGAEAPSNSPADAPDRWLLAFVDVETTGLQPGHHEMIDVGVVVTDLEGVEVGRLFRRIQPRHPERTAAGARAVNGFDARRWRQLGAVDPAEAVGLLRGFLGENLRRALGAIWDV